MQQDNNKSNKEKQTKAIRLRDTIMAKKMQRTKPEGSVIVR
jgi:hypothetical protein